MAGLFIQKVNLQVDRNQMLQDLSQLLTHCPWPAGNQIGLTHRPNAKNFWLDACGSLYDYEQQTFSGNEKEYSEWHSLCPTYTKQIVLDAAAQCQASVGRVRYMRLMPKTGLTVHRDSEHRLHYVLETNAHSYVCNHMENAALCRHLPADNNFHLVDTTQDHFVYNGGKTPRIHLVICLTLPETQDK